MTLFLRTPSLSTKFRLATAVLATAFCAALPAAVRLLTFGAMLPASRVGARCCWLWGR